MRSLGNKALCALISLTSCCCWALISSECADVALAAHSPCPSPVCGAVTVPDEGLTFLEKLSPQCKSLMLRYRTADRFPNEGKLAYGFNSTVRNFKNRQHACPSSRFSMMASNPVVVESPGVKSFVICTVPMTGCTNLRKLMNAVIRYPQSPPRDPVGQFKQAHFSSYSTLWHYGMYEVPADVYPSFIVGRNPYIRLLSGFLNKVAHDDLKDYVFTTTIETDQDINSSSDSGWKNTAESFHSFVLRLKSHGVSHASHQFRLQQNVCADGLATYEYHLPIEDIGLWFPCWEEGLDLKRFTARGWATTEHGVSWAGALPEDANKGSDHDSCWWKPPNMGTCEEFYKSTHPHWSAGDWDSLNVSPGSAVPLGSTSFGVPVAGEEDPPRDVNARRMHTMQDSMQETTVQGADFGLDVGAAHTKTHRWREYYTQEIGDLVYEMFRPDFESFGYPHETFSK